MDFYNAIKDLNEEDLKEVIDFKIKMSLYQAQNTKKRFIGVNCGINPQCDFYGEIEQDSQSMWNGFIPEDVKIIYSFLPNEQGYTVNNGCYYYIDNQDYLYEFATFIQKQDIKNDIEFLAYVYKFIDNYFNSLKPNYIHRNTMYRPLINSQGKNIESIKGHHLRDFKGKNNAECSEYTAMAENILSIFNYNTLYFGGSVYTPFGKGGHAFNLVIINNIPCIIDFTIPVEIYKINQEQTTYSPFIGVIENFNSETLLKHVKEFIPFDFKEYIYINNGKELTTISTGQERHYVIGNVEYYNEKNKILSK